MPSWHLTPSLLTSPLRCRQGQSPMWSNCPRSNYKYVVLDSSSLQSLVVGREDFAAEQFEDYPEVMPSRSIVSEAALLEDRTMPTSEIRTLASGRQRDERPARSDWMPHICGNGIHRRPRQPFAPRAEHRSRSQPLSWWALPFRVPQGALAQRVVFSRVAVDRRTRRHAHPSGFRRVGA